jgi:hypothetical protein
MLIRILLLMVALGAATADFNKVMLEEHNACRENDTKEDKAIGLEPLVS